MCQILSWTCLSCRNSQDVIRRCNPAIEFLRAPCPSLSSITLPIGTSPPHGFPPLRCCYCDQLPEPTPHRPPPPPVYFPSRIFGQPKGWQQTNGHLKPSILRARNPAMPAIIATTEELERNSCRSEVRSDDPSHQPCDQQEARQSKKSQYGLARMQETRKAIFQKMAEDLEGIKSKTSAAGSSAWETAWNQLRKALVEN
jgi:hypothetical protein